ncbi:hypothetical protein FHU38_005373 [Saccharomonospora amisosensis]|uniref:Secreted protein n=1 Tax=Saccharomonospora amisosensis TaxID=1128677 RepID=A0A7X5ZU35_9PSEU|nr:hypothetical protein [Saccharomonospora amisosensis]NIJ14965.1 hypothetical protein [Saccharomonospora amisosensis]
MTAFKKSHRGKRWARRVLPVVVATTAVVGASATPAYADAYEMSTDYCAWGRFESYGEWFHLMDRCPDGHSAVMKVDVAPLEPGDDWDFMLWNPRGSNEAISWNFSYPEGTRVCIQVGIGEYGAGTSWAYDAWDCTLA